MTDEQPQTIRQDTREAYLMIVRKLLAVAVRGATSSCRTDSQRGGAKSYLCGLLAQAEARFGWQMANCLERILLFRMINDSSRMALYFRLRRGTLSASTRRHAMREDLKGEWTLEEQHEAVASRWIAVAHTHQKI